MFQPGYLDEAGHEATNVCQHREHQRDTNYSKEQAEQATTKGLSSKITIACEIRFDRKKYTI